METYAGVKDAWNIIQLYVYERKRGNTSYRVKTFMVLENKPRSTIYYWVQVYLKGPGA